MATRELLYHKGVDHSAGTYITNYINCAVLWIMAIISFVAWKKTYESKATLTSNITNKQFSCAISFGFYGIAFIVGAVLHQYFAHSHNYANTPIGYYITVVFTIVFYIFGNIFLILVIGPIYDPKCCKKISFNVIWIIFIVFVVILNTVFLILDLLDLSFFYIGVSQSIVAFYFLIYILSMFIKTKCKVIISYWLYLAFSILLILSNILTQLIWSAGCATDDIPYSDDPNDNNYCPFHENFNHNAWYHVGVLISMIFLFVAVLLDHEPKTSTNDENMDFDAYGNHNDDAPLMQIVYSSS
eukprot:22467_1